MSTHNERGGLLNPALLPEVRHRREEFGLKFEDWQARSDQSLDAVVRLKTGSGTARTYGVPARQRLTAELATHVQPHLPALVIAPSVTIRSASC